MITQDKTPHSPHTGPIYMTRADIARLGKYISAAEAQAQTPWSIRTLSDRFSRAIMFDSEDIPPNVVTMNSIVTIIDIETSERLEMRIVFPDKADLAQRHLSVLSPGGSPMLGCRIGYEFRWELPSGFRDFVIAGIEYQPEAAGEEPPFPTDAEL